MIEDTFTLKLYPEICCDFCNDIIHNHFECPACGNTYAGTDIYGDVYDAGTNEFSCEECGAEFETVDGSNLSYRSECIVRRV
jgi:hypothetical protein